MNKKIYIIRHGETDWNKEKRAQGAEADTHLNATGIRQAEITGNYLRDFRQFSQPFDIIYSSPMIRAVETADTIARALNLSNKIIHDNRLIEIKQGSFSGTTKEDRMKDPTFNHYNELLSRSKLIKDPIAKENFNIRVIDPCLVTLGFESFEDALARADSFIKMIKNSEHEKIIIVSHSIFISALMSLITNQINMCNGNTDNGENCTVCYVKYLDDRFWVITHPNTIHLKIYE
jgi:broad specificity phosphatase PhoE